MQQLAQLLAARDAELAAARDDLARDEIIFAEKVRCAAPVALAFSFACLFMYLSANEVRIDVPWRWLFYFLAFSCFSVRNSCAVVRQWRAACGAASGITNCQAGRVCPNVYASFLPYASCAPATARTRAPQCIQASHCNDHWLPCQQTRSNHSPVQYYNLNRLKPSLICNTRCARPAS